MDTKCALVKRLLEHFAENQSITSEGISPSATITSPNITDNSNDIDFNAVLSPLVVPTSNETSSLAAEVRELRSIVSTSHDR